MCLAICVSVLPVTAPACVAAMPVPYTSHRAQALRGAADIYLCVVMFWSYLTITGNRQRAFWPKPFMSSVYLWFSCLPLAVSYRTIRPNIYRRVKCKANSSTSAFELTFMGPCPEILKFGCPLETGGLGSRSQLGSIETS